MRRRPVRKLALAATRQAASQTLCSAVEADLAPLSRSFKNHQDFSVNAAVD